MRRILTLVAVVVLSSPWLIAQQPPAAPKAPAAMLTVESIMRGPKLFGSAPTGMRWSRDSSKLYFSWQKASEDRAQNYVVDRDGKNVHVLAADESRGTDAPPTGRSDRAHKRLLAAEGGDIVVYDSASGARRVLVRTSATESNPRWVRNDTAVSFMRDGNLYVMSVEASTDAPLMQLTDIISRDDAATPANPAGGAGAAGRGANVGGGRGGQGGQGAQGGQAGRGAQGGGTATTGTLTASQQLLRDEQLALIEYLQRQAQGRAGGVGGGGGQGRGGGQLGGRAGGAGGPGGAPATPIARFELGPRQTMTDIVLSNDEKYAYIGVSERPEGTARNQDVPNYVTTSAYPEMIPGRTNVGDVQARRTVAILDVKNNKTVWADASAFAGSERKAKPTDPDVARILDWGLPDQPEDYSTMVATVRAQDNKDRWYVRIDPATGKATVLDNLHDDAWIREQGFGGGGGGGFGGGGGLTWLPDNKRFLFMSEKTGYMQLYSMDMSQPAPAARALTAGKFEVTSASLSSDKKTIFLTTNEVHPGERHFYTMSVDGGPRTKITTMTGSNDVTISPDEKSLAVIYSYTNKPPELYVMPLQAGAAAVQLTTTPSDEFRAFKWIDPKVITYKARDGQDVYARLYTPEMIGAKRDPKHPAVVFVHGAGYLQDSHKYWSTSYPREYMFNNLLASKGYVVIAPDYRASSGYGRDWRTGIYRHMGGKDLDDVVDAAKFVVQTEKVDPKRIGLYGGSYGGFITLMAMFTTPDDFAAGAALRPVTDWAHYNHGYTSNILNVPQNDMEAYKQSSPIYFAAGLKGQLLICHGMVDTNVFFQDSVRLIQRLIELGKDNWSIAPYPIENHGFTEQSSWTDEYKRIFKLFEDTLRK